MNSKIETILLIYMIFGYPPTILLLDQYVFEHRIKQDLCYLLFMFEDNSACSTIGVSK